MGAGKSVGGLEAAFRWPYTPEDAASCAEPSDLPMIEAL